MIAKSNLPAEQDISTFSFHNNSIRCILIDGEPWFFVNDICKVLSYSNPRDAVSKHVDSDDVAKCDVIDKLKRKQKVNIINESGLYCLIFSSRLAAAKEFTKWVTSEVLPAIRKYGRYDPDGLITYNKERYQSQAIPLFMADDFFSRAKTLKDVRNIMHETAFFFIRAVFNGEVTDKSLAHTLIEMFNQLNLVAHKTNGTVRTQLTTMFANELRQYICKNEYEKYMTENENQSLKEKLKKIKDMFKDLNNI